MILTALPLEAAAVKAHLEDVDPVQHPQGTIYRVGRFSENGRTWRVAVAIVGVGNAAAAFELERAIRHFNPAVVLFVGVAGGLKDVRLGDVVAADWVYGYESAKAEATLRPRPLPGLSTYAATQRARVEAEEGRWVRRILPGAGDVPRAFVGPIVAGEKVVASEASPVYRFIRENFSVALAVDMEGIGFYTAAHANREVESLVVRGISDLIDEKATADAAGSQERGASHAAAFAFQFLAAFEPADSQDAARRSRTARSDAIERLRRASRARCVERWQAAGLSPQMARALAEDAGVGSPHASIQPTPDRPVVVLEGEFGSGKSLFTERMYQRALAAFETDPARPIPVYVEVVAGSAPTLEQIREAAHLLGDPERLGVAVHLERGDEGGPRQAADCLRLGRMLVEMWPCTTAVMPVRSLDFGVRTDERVPVPLLSADESRALVRAVSGLDAGTWLQDENIAEAIQRPLFAILLGLYLRDEHSRSRHPSVGELLSNLAALALRRARMDLASAERVLMDMAVTCVDAGGGLVPSSAFLQSHLDQVLSTGLVVRRDDLLGFPLPIVTQFFAARALTMGVVDSTHFTQDVELLHHWRLPLAMALSSGTYDQVARVMEPVARVWPGAAARALADAIGHRFDVRSTVGRPHDAGRRIRRATAAWIDGAGRLSSLMAPLDSRGSLCPIGIAANAHGIVVSWYEGGDVAADVLDLPTPVEGAGWRRVTFTAVREHPAWHWGLAHDEIVGRLGEILRHGVLPLDDSNPLAGEMAWAGALRLLDKGSLYDGDLSLDDVEGALSRHSSWEHAVRTYDGLVVDAELIRRRVRLLRRAGLQVMGCPHPGGDIEPDRTRSFVWSVYSPQRLVERTRSVYEAALHGYSALVDEWLESFRLEMPHASLLPVRMRGVVVPARRRRGRDDATGDPKLRYRFVLLPPGVESEVDMVLGGDERAHDLDDHMWNEFRRLRPKSAALSISGGGSALLRVFGSWPSTRIAFDWLRDDFRVIHWN